MNQAIKPSKGDVPFSWEKKPGVSKVRNPSVNEKDFIMQKIPLPPCPPENQIRVSVSKSRPLFDSNIPLPPCTFQPPYVRSSSRKGLARKQDDDPFLAAYKECTKSTRKEKHGLRTPTFLPNFSCKNSCNVRDDNLVRVSQLPCQIDSGRVIRGHKLHP
ncbi:hypothetical protein M5689_016827 [Euphorbia peplus]|nr:hypothetical protein M5689_016827 [Euphorbia peplus]